jgi:hypothetical protein
VVLVVVFVDTFFPAPPPFALDEGVIIRSLTYTRIIIISLSLHSPATTKRFFSLNTLDDAQNKVKRTTKDNNSNTDENALFFSKSSSKERFISRRKRRQFFPITRDYILFSFFPILRDRFPPKRFHTLYLSLNEEKKKKAWKKLTSWLLVARVCVKSVCVYMHTQNAVKRESRFDDGKMLFRRNRSTYI